MQLALCSSIFLLLNVFLFLCFSKFISYSNYGEEFLYIYCCCCLLILTELNLITEVNYRYNIYVDGASKCIGFNVYRPRAVMSGIFFYQ